MLVDEPRDFAHLVETSLAEGARGHQVTDGIEPRSGEPDMGWRIPASLLDARPCLFGQHALHRLTQRVLRHAVTNLRGARHAEHELDHAVVEKRREMLDVVRGAVTVFGAETARQRLAEH